MNPKEASEFEGRVAAKCKELSTMSLGSIRATIANSKVSEKEKTIYRLELHYRLHGGESPYQQILRKIADEHNLVVDGESKMTFTVP